MAANVKYAKQIPAETYLIYATNASLCTYLAGLAAPNFLTVADVKAKWAVQAANAGSGTATLTGGTAFIVSKRVYMRSVKGHIYS